MKKTIIKEYDKNGKLIRETIIEEPDPTFHPLPNPYPYMDNRTFQTGSQYSRNLFYIN